MRFVKAFGLAALAAVAAMAFLGAGTASAQTHDIVLCKELVTLCPAGKLWPAGTLLEALAKEPKLLSSLGTIECEDSYILALATEEVGHLNSGVPEYLLDNVVPEFGVLPTPTLGLGCTGPCGATNQDWIHASFESSRLLVENVDKYFILGAGLALILNCLGLTCVFRANHVKVPITHTGTHLLHPGNNLPLAHFEVPLTRQTTHSGSSLCPATATWHAKYTFTLAKDHISKTEGLAWPSLDKKA